jgi:hypothetical protein
MDFAKISMICLKTKVVILINQKEKKLVN